MIILISGKSGSGKSSVAKYIADKLNYLYVDLDDLTRTIRDESKDEIVSLVGTSRIIKSNKIDSKVLGDILFSNKGLMNKYNLFIYKKQIKLLDELKSHNENLVIDSMFIPIMDIFKEGDYKILVVCDDKIRYERILKRDSISEEYLKKRDAFSLEYNNKDFDLVIDNSFGYQNQLDDFINKIKGE